jgi:hypothetical protein
VVESVLSFEFSNCLLHPIFTILTPLSSNIAPNHPRTQGLFGKDPGIVWLHDSTKINCPRGSGKVSNYMLEMLL